METSGRDRRRFVLLAGVSSTSGDAGNARDSVWQRWPAIFPQPLPAASRSALARAAWAV